jgi:hypothetical protein
MGVRRMQQPQGYERAVRVLSREYPGERKFHVLIPPLLEKKYLKTIFNCHRCAGTLDACDAGRDEEITVLDIDSIVHKA